MSLLRGSTNRGAVNPREDEEGAMEMVGTNFFILKSIFRLHGLYIIGHP
jgi:hypothetical protein